MLGLALEGGGAKGSYQVGAYLALKELGFKFDYIVGTSIGAINGAVLAQGDEELAKDIWLDIKYSTVVDADDERIYKFVNEDLTLKNFREKFLLIKDVISEGGFDTTPFKQLLDKYIDEDKVRNSDIKFGLVTVDLSHFRPIEIFIDEMEKGTLKEYLYASSNLPVFKQEPIRGRYLIDGGFYTNNPVKMLEDKCDKIVNIILYPERKIPELNPDVELITIAPREKLTDIMNFTSSEARRGINLGYYDTYKVIENLLGDRYYIRPFEESESLEIIIKLYKELEKNGETEYTLRKFIERGIPRYIIREDIEKDSNYKEIIAYALEKMAIELKVEQFKIYELRELSQILFENPKFEDLPEKYIFEKSLVKVICGDDN